jgi:alpha-tubulin suppressor-like RCC1 family protein
LLPGLSITAIAAGLGHTCALRSNGSLVCWGWNGYGQLGIGSTKNVGDFPGYRLAAVNLGSGIV